MPNIYEPNHPMEGFTFIWAGMPPDPNFDYEEGDDSGEIIAAPGDKLMIERVFHNWNDVDGLTVAWVYNLDRDCHLHLSIREMQIEDEWSNERY